jgi:hypothetical protein
MAKTAISLFLWLDDTNLKKLVGERNNKLKKLVNSFHGSEHHTHGPGRLLRGGRTQKERKTSRQASYYWREQSPWCGCGM